MTETTPNCNSIVMSTRPRNQLCAATAANGRCAPPAHTARRQAIVCKECVRAHQKSFDTSEWYDYIFGFHYCRLSFGRGGIPRHFDRQYRFHRLVFGYCGSAPSQGP